MTAGDFIAFHNKALGRARSAQARLKRQITKLEREVKSFQELHEQALAGIIPAGSAIMPSSPTDQMIRAAQHAILEGMRKDPSFTIIDSAEAIYKAMVAVAWSQ